ncbi:MAG: SIMPL domain-containing protein [Chitinophagaceae bacterium]|jgi:hypothetical protein|nr:SIMPL domain-containing protein [Chitinophagaceae bacterium]
MPQKKSHLLGSLCCILCLFSFAALPAHAQLPDQPCPPGTRCISVTGSAETEVVPDIIIVSVTLREYNRSRDEKLDLATIREQFLATCQQLGIADSNIAIGSYRGSQLDLYKSKRQQTSLTANLTYEIRLQQMKQVQQLADALDDRSTQYFAIARLDHTQMSSLRRQVKAEAAKVARQKAAYLLEAVGEKPGQLLSLTEPAEAWNAPIMPSQGRFSNNAFIGGDFAGAADGDNIFFKKIKIRFEINAVFSIL